MSTTMEKALQRSVNALGLGDLTPAEAEQALRREACELAAELIREFVRDGECSVTVTFAGVRREDWDALPFPQGSYHADTKWQAIASRKVLVEYVAEDDSAPAAVIHDGVRLVKEVRS